jgi:hypothetical protein
MRMRLGAVQLRRSKNLRSGGHHLRKGFVRIDRRGGLDRERSGYGKARRFAVGVQGKVLRDDLAPRTILRPQGGQRRNLTSVRVCTRGRELRLPGSRGRADADRLKLIAASAPAGQHDKGNQKTYAARKEEPKSPHEEPPETKL